MATKIEFDGRDFAKLARDLKDVPADIKRKAWWAARKRVGDKLRTQIVKRTAERLDLPQKLVRPLTRSYAGRNDSFGVTTRSQWLSLTKVGGKRLAKVLAHIPPRSSYGRAFIARTKSGYEGVFRRETSDRYPLKPLYGPNPAHDIYANSNVYQALLADFAESDLLPRYLHEINFRLARLGATK